MSSIRLKLLKYSERLGTPKEWVLDALALNQVNLVVGKNATGKSRALAVIFGLARLLTAQPRFVVQYGAYDLTFDNEGVEVRYVLEISEGLIISEQYFVNGRLVLNRGADGVGEIQLHLPGVGPQMVNFSPSANDPAVLVKRDSILHPFLEPLHQWVEATRYYTFGTNLGRDTIAVLITDGPEADDRDFNQVVGIFRRAEKQFGEPFAAAVRRDMGRMGYQIDRVEVVVPENIKIHQANVPAQAAVIGVREEGLDRVIEQTEMSQGMFRALSILIQVNYSQMANRASCILIDDIGEGLDFERSTSLISILREKAAESNFQLVMTTNDRFVMNNVPLSEWTVLQRSGGVVKARNYENSRELFDEFRFTGLSNFSFFEMDFIGKDGFSEEEE